MLRLYALSLPARVRLVGARQASTSAENATEWSPHSRRTGVIARKRGMTAMWDENGVRIPLTVLQMENCQVTANIVSQRKDSSFYHAVQVAAGDRTAKTCTRQMLGHFRKAGVPPKRIVAEFKVTGDAHVPVGTALSAIHFVPGQFVDVVSKSIGKGFQGGMKRWGFHGLAASHGVSISHRSLGSTGQHQDPGRVWPGQKMAGRLGGERVTTQNLNVVRIDSSLNLIFVKGCVPGIDDAFVLVSDAKKGMEWEAQSKEMKGAESCLPKGVDALPFPAGTTEMAKKLPAIIVARPQGRNPFIPRD